MPYKDRNRQRAYQQEWQKNNRKPRCDQGGAITKRNIIISAKSKPCELCGGTFHSSAMHFHHIDPTTKIASISQLERRGSVAKIIEEMNKCILVCANCHAEVHAGVREIFKCHERESNPQGQ